MCSLGGTDNKLTDDSFTSDSSSPSKARLLSDTCAQRWRWRRDASAATAHGACSMMCTTQHHHLTHANMQCIIATSQESRRRSLPVILLFCRNKKRIMQRSSCGMCGVVIDCVGKNNLERCLKLRWASCECVSQQVVPCFFWNLNTIYHIGTRSIFLQPHVIASDGSDVPTYRALQ